MSEKQTVTKADVETVDAAGIIGKEVPDAADKTPRLTAYKRELEARRDELQGRLAPHREFYEAHSNDPKFIEAKNQIRELQKELGPVMNELAALARVSTNNVGGIKAEAGEYKRG